jgi:hypothetical protein
VNKEKHFSQCLDLLSPWLGFLEVESLKHYPNHMPGIMKEWIDSLKQLGEKQLWEFQNNFDLKFIDSDSLKQLVFKIQDLTRFRKLEISKNCLPDKLLRKIKPKKKHEINSILQMVESMGQVDFVMDIGGGVGHLSTALVHAHDRSAFCVDCNEKLQNSGQARLEKWDKESLSKIKFLNYLVDGEFKINEFDRENNRLVVGLHSCGSLGSNLVKMVPTRNYEKFILASCCYHKLNGDYNLSDMAKGNGIIFSENALHLASRCHRYETYKEFQDKLMLRRYRYGLHLLKYKLGVTKFEAIGNTDLIDYQSSFYTYVQKYSPLIQISEMEANNFYNMPLNQNIIEEIILSDIIRSFFGRLIEVYLILDRSLYLNERGYEVQLLEAFSRKMSPRNIVIYSSKNLV